MADYKEAKSICNLNPSAYVPAGHPIAAPMISLNLDRESSIKARGGEIRARSRVVRLHFQARGSREVPDPVRAL